MTRSEILKLFPHTQSTDWHQHVNGNGWVYKDAHVDATAYIGPDAIIAGTARVFGDAYVYGYAIINGNMTIDTGMHVGFDPANLDLAYCMRA